MPTLEILLHRGDHSSIVRTGHIQQLVLGTESFSTHLRQCPLHPHPQSSVILRERRWHRGTAGTNFPASKSFPPIFACPVTRIWSCILVPAPAVAVTANQPVSSQWAGFQESQRRERRLSKKCWQSPCALQTKDSTTAHPAIREVCRAWTALGGEGTCTDTCTDLFSGFFGYFLIHLSNMEKCETYKRREDIIISSHISNIHLKKTVNLQIILFPLYHLILLYYLEANTSYSIISSINIPACISLKYKIFTSTIPFIIQNHDDI